MKTLIPIFLLALGATAPALALDGKWTPGQVLEIDADWLKTQGLQLPPDGLWDAKRGTGLLAGTVLIGGCSGAFVSATGLIVTNHHCLFSLIQEHSTPARDLMRDGFLARAPADELNGRTLTVEIPRRFTDVTARITERLPREAGARAKAIKARMHGLVSSCEQNAKTKCKVSVQDEGVQYTLVESTELRDIRLVYAPPRAVGEFGGEIDNWMWPRHTGDFAIARAWAGADGSPADRSPDNLPFKPEFFFPISERSLNAGDFVMVLGYPGITWRALLAEEMAERRARFFPRREDVFGQWVDTLKQGSAGDPVAEIALAANVKSILNRYKNAQGQIVGLDRGKVLDKQRAQDDAVAAFAAAAPAHRGALEAREKLRTLLAERDKTWERDFLLNLLPMGVEAVPGGIPPLPKALYFGATLAHWAREAPLADAERATGFADDDLPRLRERLRREQQSYSAKADQRLLAALIARALALPADQRIASVDARFAKRNPEQIATAVAALYANSPLLDADARDALLGANVATLTAKKDALLDFGLAWNADLRALRADERARAAISAIYRPIWRRAVAAHAKQPIAPDANGTLRVSFAHVQGYAPRDGVYYTPFTSLSGLLEKHTGQAPFDVPASMLAAARTPGTRWLPQGGTDLSINFLADGDTSGGNSGSPVVNGYGELVGINFDRVWENVAGDFGFNKALSRNISVDIRYLLWSLDRVEAAKELLAELGLQQRPESKSAP